MKNKLVVGVGVYKKGKYPASINRKPTKVYKVWKHMLERCYDTKVQERQPTYIGCSVCSEWYDFQTFGEWYETNYPKDGGKYELDKDLKIIGNKVYSPDTCLFVSNQVNSFTINCGASRGRYMIGVCRHKHAGKFQARCRNTIAGKGDYLGLFTSEIEAHLAWRKHKSSLAFELAMIQKNEDVKLAILRWKDLLDNNLIHTY